MIYDVILRAVYTAAVFVLLSSACMSISVVAIFVGQVWVGIAFARFENRLYTTILELSMSFFSCFYV